MSWSWDAWRLDLFTWLWVAWFGFFVVVETLALMSGNQQELTAHLRPLFINHSLLWFVALGIWGWLGVHLLAPAVESWLISLVGGR